MTETQLSKTNTVSLIGMPGAGKSTAGVILAKAMGLDFVDTDLLIQSREQATLQEILESRGYLALRDIEEEVILAAEFQRCIISTGGSAVYSDAAMNRLRSMGQVVFLDVPFSLLSCRINNMSTRGIARVGNQTLEDVYQERLPLYRKYADITVAAYDKTIEETAADVIRLLAA
jgi:shikimate kinase